LPAKASSSGHAGSTSSRVSPSRPISSSATAASRARTRGSTLVNAARITPSPSLVVSMTTGPTAVSNRNAPGPRSEANATAVAIVACPQNGTSATGEK
jgi:hypothetical protein